MIAAPALLPSAASGKRDVARLVIDDGFGCERCRSWGLLLRGIARFDPEILSAAGMDMLRMRLGIPPELASCHTALVQGYVIEGHVPEREVATLLSSRPSGIRGLAVAGRPAGSAGLMHESGISHAFEVVAIHADGDQSVFASYEGFPIVRALDG